MSQHARRHWLELQAKRAVSDALEFDVTGVIKSFEAELREQCFVMHMAYRGGGKDHLRLSLMESRRKLRDALIECELLHRECVKRGVQR